MVLSKHTGPAHETCDIQFLYLISKNQPYFFFILQQFWAVLLFVWLKCNIKQSFFVNSRLPGQKNLIYAQTKGYHIGTQHAWPVFSYQIPKMPTLFLCNPSVLLKSIHEPPYEKNEAYWFFLVSRKTVIFFPSAHFYYNSLCSILEVPDISEFPLN